MTTAKNRKMTASPMKKFQIFIPKNTNITKTDPSIRKNHTVIQTILMKSMITGILSRETDRNMSIAGRRTAASQVITAHSPRKTRKTVRNPETTEKTKKKTRNRRENTVRRNVLR